MKLMDEKDNLNEAIKGADLSAKRKAFRNHLPYGCFKGW